MLQTGKLRDIAALPRENRNLAKSMSSFLRKAASYVDDASAKKSIRLKILHIALGHPVTLCFMSVMAAGLIHKIVVDKMTAAEATKDFITLLGCFISCISAAFWMSYKPGLCIIFTHLADAAQILEEISKSAKKSLQKKMANVERRGRLPFYGMWCLATISFLGSVVTAEFDTDIYLLEGAPSWFRILIEFAHTIQAVGFGLPGVCSAVLITLLVSEAIFDSLNDGLRNCDGNEDFLKDLIKVHQELLTALMIARNLFRYVLLSHALIWCPALLLSMLNVLSGCYGVPAMSLLPIGSIVIMSACEAGDILVRKSLDASQAVIYSGWEDTDAVFRQDVMMILRRSQRPAYLKIHLSGMLCRERMKIFKTMYSAFTIMLSVFDSSTCEA